MRKQKLSPEASKAKAIRDKKIAMTGHRKKRKRENERMGQRSDSDIHHTKDGKQVRVSINKNRGNFGKGTKSEGPNMMGQTWLNRRIKGPNAEGDPVKKKKGGVKPYQAIDMADYNNRQQLYGDSLAVFNASENIKNRFAEGLRPGETFTEESVSKTSNTADWEDSLKQLDDFSKFKKDVLVLEKSKVKPTSTSEFWNKKRVEDLPIFSNPFTEKSNTSKDVLAFNAPNYDKPKQKILPPPATKKKSTITKSVVKKKRPQDTISKMPIGKSKSKSTTPKKLKSRENMKMLTQTVMGTSGKREPAHQYKKRKGLSDEQMYRSFPGLKPSKTK